MRSVRLGAKTRKLHGNPISQLLLAYNALLEFAVFFPSLYLIQEIKPSAKEIPLFLVPQIIHGLDETLSM